MHALHAAANCRLDRGRLRQHALGQSTVLAETLQPRQIDIGDQRCGIPAILEDAGSTGHEYQLLGIQRCRQRRGHGVRVDVQQRAGFVRRQRADDRHEAARELRAQHVRIDGFDVADEAVVDRARIDARHFDGRSLVRANQSSIDAADAHRRQVDVTACGQYSRVDLPVQHHRCDLEGRLVGHPAPFDELRLDAQALCQFGRLRATAVNEHDAYPEFVQDADLLHEIACRLARGE